MFDDSDVVLSKAERLAGRGDPMMELGGEGQPSSTRWTGGWFVGVR